jgi:hypothetical protein
MKLSKLIQAGLALAGLVFLAGNVGAASVGSAFTYQGRLDEGGTPANGSYDLTFSLQDAATGGAQVGVTVTNSAVVVSNGLFAVTLDFGANAFDGNARWLEIGVRKGTNEFTALSPRQAVTPTPYALMAASLSAPLPDNQLPAGVARLSANQSFSGSNSFSGVVVAGNAANGFWGRFHGDGSGLTNLDTSAVTAATNDLNTTLSAKTVAATNGLWIATTNLVTAATNNLNTALSAKIVAATNTLWIASTNWVMSQGYQATNGLTRKPISSAVPSNGTNYVVDFANEVVQIAATNHITLVQSTNRPAAGWYGECVWYIQGGTANWTLRVNTNWDGVGTLATNTPYVIPSNKLTIVALSARGTSETNVTYAIGRQE